jgi:hypothetical protein
VDVSVRLISGTLKTYCACTRLDCSVIVILDCSIIVILDCSVIVILDCSVIGILDCSVIGRNVSKGGYVDVSVRLISGTLNTYYDCTITVLVAKVDMWKKKKRRKKQSKNKTSQKSQDLSNGA